MRTKGRGDALPHDARSSLWPTNARALPPGTPCAGEILGGNLVIQGVIGVGGMGVVLAAEMLPARLPVAVKRLRNDILDRHETRDEDLERFLREAHAVSRLRSRHVVRVLDIAIPRHSTLQFTPYFVMERLHGRDLADRLRSDHRLAIDEGVDLVIEACDAIAEAHALGIVHRDLKPSNLFLAETSDVDGAVSPIVKVLDFGISKLLDNRHVDMQITATSTVIGTPLYMAPEVMRSAKNASARSDVWALGVILYEILSGQTPYFASSLAELSVLMSSDAPPPVRALRREVPPALAALIDACLERDVDARLSSVEELARRLAEFGSRRGQRVASGIAKTIAAALAREKITAPSNPSEDEESTFDITIPPFRPRPVQPTMGRFLLWAAAALILAAMPIALARAVGARARTAASAAASSVEAKVSTSATAPRAVRRPMFVAPRAPHSRVEPKAR